MAPSRSGLARPTHPVVESDRVVVWRCWGCNKFLLRAEEMSGRIDLTCPRCGRQNLVRVASELSA